MFPPFNGLRDSLPTGIAEMRRFCGPILFSKIKFSNFVSEVGRGGGHLGKFLLDMSPGLSDPLTHYSLFCGPLYTPSYSLLGKYSEIKKKLYIWHLLKKN